MHTTTSIRSKASITKDIEGPINNQMFFQHSSNKRLTDDYTVGKVIGQGAYGKVKLVTHKKSGVVRATKHIRKKLVLKEAKTEDLFQEVNILLKLDHPNIVKLYHLYEDNKDYIMVTEYCSGGELFERIQKNQSFSEKHAAQIMRQILGALSYLHEKQIVHRDIKAENLLFENQNQDANVKLIDFGVSTKFIQGSSEKMKETLGTVSLLD